MSNNFFNYTELLDRIKQEFQISLYGDHGLSHWQRVFTNTQLLSSHYQIQTDVFELFSLLHDSKRDNELYDEKHGPRAAAFTKKLINEKLITLEEADEQRLLFACANHTVTDTKSPLSEDIIVQICFDSDRLDIGRVGIEPHEKYMATSYAKNLVINKRKNNG